MMERNGEFLHGRLRHQKGKPVFEVQAYRYGMDLTLPRSST